MKFSFVCWLKILKIQVVAYLAKILKILPLFSVLLVSCAGWNSQVVLVQDTSSVFYGVEKCLKGEFGSSIAINGEYLLFSWAENGGMKITVFDMSKGVSETGQVYKLFGSKGMLNGTTPMQMKEVLIQAGWRVISSSEIPLNYMKAITSGSSWMKIAPTIFVMPVQMLTPPFPQKISQ